MEWLAYQAAAGLVQWHSGLTDVSQLHVRMVRTVQWRSIMQREPETPGNPDDDLGFDPESPEVSDPQVDPTHPARTGNEPHNKPRPKTNPVDEV